MSLPHVFRPPMRRVLGPLVAVLVAAPLALVLSPPRNVAAAVPALTIVSKSDWYEPGRNPARHIVGEIRNDDASQTAKDILVHCSFLTPAGDVVAEDTMPADAAVLQPGEKSPFDVIFTPPPGPFDHYDCNLLSAPTITQPDHNFTATVDTVSPVDPVTHAQVITGTVTNNNTIAVADVNLYFTLYRNGTDNPRRTIAEDILSVNNAIPLAPGSVTPYTLTRFKPAWDGVAYALLAEAPTPAVSLSPGSMSLTRVKTTTSDAQIVTLTNVGTADLHVGTLTLAGAHPGDWAELDSCAGVTIVPLGSCSIQVRFTPADVGDRSATLIVADDANQNPHTLVLNGIGTNPEASFSPSPLTFLPQAIGKTSAKKSLTVTNSGVGDLHVGAASLTGLDAGDYTITDDACSGSTVPQGTSCTLQLTFHPSATGARNASVSLSDDALDSPQTLAVSGNGVVSTVGFDAASYGFGNQKVATTSNAVIVTLTNKGASILTVTSACASPSPEFSAGTNGCAAGFSVAPSETHQVTVTFTPAQTGVRTGALTLIDNAPDSPQSVSLSGNGTFGGQYHPLTPVRIYDTRDGAGALGAGLQGAPLRVVTIASGTPVPLTATAVVMNVTVTNTTAASFLTVYPTGATRPTASNLNWVAGQTVPNLVEVGLSGGSVSIYNAAGSTDVIFDVAGYVTPQTASPGPDGFFNPMPPARVLDTRSAIGAPAARVLGDHQVDVQLKGFASVPLQGVAAVVLNVTVTNATAPSFLTVYPTGDARPNASNLNFASGQTIPNRVMVKVGAGGKVSFYSAAGATDVIADVGGWFSDATVGGTGAGFNPVTPTRILDTRDPSGLFNTPVGQAPIALTVAGKAGILGMGSATPPSAVVLNVTVTGPNAASYLSLWPALTARPTASDLNFTRGQTVPNLVVVKVGADGKVNIFNAAGSTDVIVDVVGWYS